MVSVIIPIFNSEKYIRRSIESVLSQSFKDIELILIDDGSTDSSGEICKEYLEKDLRVKYFRQENSGPDIARKTGVQKAQGEWLCFLDSDDYFSEIMIEDMFQKGSDENCDLVCCNLMRFNEKKAWKLETNVDSIVILEGQTEISEAFFKKRNIPGGYPAKIIKRELLEDYPFIQNAVIGEDVSGILYIIERAKKIVLLPEHYYFYYWHTGSISHGTYTFRHLVSLKNYISVKEYQKNRKLIEKKYIDGFFAEHEMAVATAMSRGKVFDREAAGMLREDMKKTAKSVYQNEVTPLYMKVCIFIFLRSPKLFMSIYRVIYLVTGR